MFGMFLALFISRTRSLRAKPAVFLFDSARDERGIGSHIIVSMYMYNPVRMRRTTDLGPPAMPRFHAMTAPVLVLSAFHSVGVSPLCFQ